MYSFFNVLFLSLTKTEKTNETRNSEDTAETEIIEVKYQSNALYGRTEAAKAEETIAKFEDNNDDIMRMSTATTESVYKKIKGW